MSCDFEHLTDRVMNFCVDFLSVLCPNAKKIKGHQWDEEMAYDVSQSFHSTPPDQHKQHNKPDNPLEDIIVIKEQTPPAPPDIENNMKEVTHLIQTMTEDREPQVIRKWPLNFIPPRHLRVPTYIYHCICESNGDGKSIV